MLTKDEAIVELKKYLKPGDTVYTVLKHVSRSGMYRVIDVYVIKKNEPRWLSRYAARACGFRFDERHEGVGVSGRGMDMGFHVVYALGSVLWPEGFKLRKGQRGRNGDTSGYDHDGRYALNQRWM